MPFNPRVRRLLIISAAMIVAALAAIIWAVDRKYRSTPVTPMALPSAGGGSDSPDAPSPSTATPTPLLNSSPEPSPTANASPLTELSATPAAPGEERKLLIPVAGITANQLQDTYTDARSEGRTHNAIDIIAPRGTPVLAAADGHIVKFFNSVQGGITIYQLDPDNRTVYYYAHLDRYADELEEGDFARRGQVIAYVGDTGNATPGNYHLHFSVSIVSDPKRHWDGVNINPYPLLVK